MVRLEWAGKDKVVNHHKDVPFRKLDRIYSYDKDGEHAEDNGSENMIVHGDNLEALKALLPKYEGKVKCVYIDPPYNTGNEGWIYNDNMTDPFFKKWLGDVVGKEGEDFSRHDKWLCMMYPRLVLLKKLLREDGAIFISIDDNEIGYLRMVMDEIFGTKHFIAQISLLCNPKGRSQDKYFATNHEYLLVYSKGYLEPGSFSVEKDPEQIEKQYKLSDEKGKYRLLNLRNTHREFGKHNRPNLWYPFYVNPDDGSVSLDRDESHTVEVLPLWDDGFEGCWTWDRNRSTSMLDMIASGKTKAGKWNIFRKNYGETGEDIVRTKLFTIWSNPKFYTEKGQAVFGQIFPGASKEDFPQPKSVQYIEEVVRCFTHDDDIILDSFAGSGTTGHAVLNVNSDGGDRRFILLEKMNYANPITAERIKRVIQGYGDVPGIDSSFSFYELGEPYLIDGDLNPSLDLETIRGYIFYMETKQPYIRQEYPNPAMLGRVGDTAYYLLYGEDVPTQLDDSFITCLDRDSTNHVVYADSDYMSERNHREYNIRFAKIPRDVRGH